MPEGGLRLGVRLYRYWAFCFSVVDGETPICSR
jgi:hypothetical protein